ncbi:MAG: DUF1772 domain-containing protein [Hyphomicrobium sp.]|uniref:DUF1772 domain-containing protein n=1 Tax=Hyphomicrobium sp. TaxID=82 RepID=UPI003D095E73
MDDRHRSGTTAEPASQALDLVFFASLLSTALSLGPALAHLLALPNKINLPQADYFVAQQVYRGWAFLGVLILAQILSILALIVMTRRAPHLCRLAALALFCVAAAQLLFWIFTFPANRRTENWTVAPADWESLRQQWEYSHAGGALLQLLALIALIWALLAYVRARRPV